MTKFIRDINRLNSLKTSTLLNEYLKYFKDFKNQIIELIRYHFDLLSLEVGSLSKDNHNHGIRGYVSIDISELYENFIKDKTIQTEVDLVWVDSSEIKRSQDVLASQAWFLQLKQMVKVYDSANYVNLCLSVKNAEQLYLGRSLPVFVLQLPILSR